MNFLSFSEAWRRRRAGLLHDRKRQYDQNRQYQRHRQFDQIRQHGQQAVADEMVNGRETGHENDLGTKLDDQEHDEYLYDDEI